jgi:heavy metal sensor kinase
MFIRSIRWRFLLWLAVLLGGVLALLGVLAFKFHRSRELARIDDELARLVGALSSDLRQPPTPAGGPSPRRDPTSILREPPPPPGPPPSSRALDELPIHLTPEIEATFGAGQNARGFYYAIWSPAGAVRRKGGVAVDTIPFPARTNADTSIHERTRGVLREAWHFTERGNGVLVGRAIAEDLAALRRFAWLLAGGGIAVLAFALGGGAWLVGRALKPVDAIGATATRIASGNLAERIDLAETDSELGQLAKVLNDSFSRLETAFAQQRQFTADAAHELRTPLAVLISEAQLALSRERSATEYGQALEVCLSTAQKMRRLAETLLQLARIDAGQERLSSEPFDLGEVTRDCVEMIRPLAEARALQLHAEIDSASCVGDSVRISQVVTNLLANAIEYNRDGGEVRVSVHRRNGSAIVIVADSGVGIPEPDLPRIFERFHRADTARSGEAHTGLGLAICKAIVEAHHGTIEATSEPGNGTTLTVTLPASTG